MDRRITARDLKIVLLTQKVNKKNMHKWRQQKTITGMMLKI